MADKTRPLSTAALRTVLREAEAGARLIGAVAAAPLGILPAERLEMLRLSDRLAGLADGARTVVSVGGRRA